MTHESDQTQDAGAADRLRDLHQALADFYDPPRLQANPLVAELGLAGRPHPATALQSLLSDAIQALRPDPSVPRDAPVHRYYRLLHERYVEQFTQKEVAADLGLSVRQLRRQEKLALEMLAAQIAPVRPSPHHTQSGAGDQMNTAITPSRQEELAWTQKTFPQETAELAPLLASVLQIAAPLLQSLGTEVTLTHPPHLPRLAVPLMSVRQSLLTVLTSVARGARGAQLVFDVRVHEQTVSIHLSTSSNRTLAALATRDQGEMLRMAADLVEPSGGILEILLEDGRFEVAIHLPSEQQVTVLAVDDNPDTLHLLSRYVANTRYHLVGVSKADQVLVLAQRVDPAVIVLDVMMPQIDGWELLGKLRSHPDLAHVPIVVCTILPQEQLARSLGAGAFLRKPIRRSDFLAALDAQVALLR